MRTDLWVVQSASQAGYNLPVARPVVHVEQTPSAILGWMIVDGVFRPVTSDTGRLVVGEVTARVAMKNLIGELDSGWYFAEWAPNELDGGFTELVYRFESGRTLQDFAGQEKLVRLSESDETG